MTVVDGVLAAFEGDSTGGTVKALRDRGDVTVWISHEVINAWTPPPNGKRGAQPVYSDVAIETARFLPASQ